MLFEYETTAARTLVVLFRLHCSIFVDTSIYTINYMCQNKGLIAKQYLGDKKLQIIIWINELVGLLCL